MRPPESITTAAKTVADVLRTTKVTLGASDTVSPAASAAVTDGLTIVVQRRSTTTLVRTVTVAKPADVTVHDANLDQGTKKVVDRALPAPCWSARPRPW